MKRRETEQQAEARLKSYAHLAEQEKADQWVALDYHGGASGGWHCVCECACVCGALAVSRAQASWERAIPRPALPGSLHSPA